MAFGNV